MMGLFFYTIAAFGLAYIVGHSGISLPFRMLLDPGEELISPTQAARSFVLMLIECPACFGFWTGVFAGMLYLWIDGAYYPKEGPLAKFLFAFGLALYTTGSNFILARFTNLIPSPTKE